MNFALEKGVLIAPNEEKIIILSSGTAQEIKLDISSGTFTSTTTITVTRKTDLLTPDTFKQPNLKGTGIGIQVDASTQPLKPVTITVSYTDAELIAAGITNETDLVLARYDEDTKEWVILSSTPIPAENKIIATVEQFSLFQIIQITTRPRAGETVTVYHGVFDPASGEKVGIAYTLSGAGEVKIVVYDSLGRQIGTVFAGSRNTGNYLDWWYGKNDSEETVASGVYLIYIETPGVKVMKKVVVVK
ncbi:MAG TPA: hypothetical protein DHV62_10750 [Elusimicrobia bacterium]|nr:hypothetical protein [Elusimicrobiota bacterium]